MVFGVGVIEIWFAVPTGLALGLPAPVIWVMTAAGGIASVTFVAYAGDALRARILHRRAQIAAAEADVEPAPQPGRIRALWRRYGPPAWWHSSPQKGRIFSIWVRYGVPGWGLVSPLVMAPPMGTGVALALGAPRRRLMVWMYAGVVLWTTIIMSGGLAILELLHTIR